MRMQYVLCFLIAMFSGQAVAAEAVQNLKQEVEKIGSAYNADGFAKTIASVNQVGRLR